MGRIRSDIIQNYLRCQAGLEFHSSSGGLEPTQAKQTHPRENSRKLQSRGSCHDQTLGTNITLAGIWKFCLNHDFPLTTNNSTSPPSRGIYARQSRCAICFDY
jgi:hypothetical protein